LDNLTIIVDRNNFQQTGSSNSILDLKNLKNKFESFGCFVLDVDGHNLSKIYNAFSVKNLTKKPKVIIANTIKGKGFKTFENNNSWHHSVITKSIYKEIQREI
jgi:transketolase